MDTVTLCIDTNILIDYLKGREPGANSLERALSEHRCAITAITHYELLYGMARARHSIGEEQLMEVFSVLPFDENASSIAAALHADLIRRNQDIGVKDVLIAAICLNCKLPLLTANLKHFSRVAGLSIISPHETPWCSSP